METSIKSLVIEINVAFEKSDLDFLGKHLSDDIIWNISGKEELITGKAAVLKCCESAPFKAGSLIVTVTNILVDGDQAVAEGILDAVTLTDGAYRQKFCDIYHFDGDKIDKMTTYLDTAYDQVVLDGGSVHPNG
jgi:ketosteroid isomerase-like protein